MKYSIQCLGLVAGLAFSGIQTNAQDDETRQGTGLPVKIGENVATGNRMNVSGRIVLAGSEKLTRKPVVTVAIQISGVPVDRAMANDAGFYLIKNVPRGNVTLIIEVDGSEVSRQQYAASGMGNPRIDLSIPWPAAAPPVKPSVVSAGNAYKRSERNEERFQNALAAIRIKDNRRAVELFGTLLEADPKDYVAWGELGTLYFNADSLNDAEACYFKAIEIKRDYFMALLNLGKLYIRKKQFDNAVLVLTNAAATRPDSADAHQFLGEAYLQNKKGSAAVTHFNEAIKLDPAGKAEIHIRLAALYDAAGGKAMAATEYERFLQKRPDHSEKQKLLDYIKTHGKK